MNVSSKRFVDEFSNVHLIRDELDRGGQGVVYRTTDPDIAIKIALDGAGQPVMLEKHRQRFRLLRRLPLPNNINISLPAAILVGVAGYAMRLLDEMVSFKHFEPTGLPFNGGSDAELPDWVRGLPESDMLKLLHYASTGGLRRRLLGLYKCAAILGRLHSVGIVYGDISPNNVFISRNLKSREVWLIDADNLRFEVTGPGSTIFTPGFGAPELVQGIGSGSCRSDCHAFAAMAFWMLTLVHPFIGDYVTSGGTDDWANDETGSQPSEDLQSQAFAGKLPWVADQDDDKNHSDSGLPRSLVLTPQLETLFQEAFGAGRTRPWRRPAMLHWPAALAQALDTSVTCKGCGMGYFVSDEIPCEECPYCKRKRPKLLKVTAYCSSTEPNNSPPCDCHPEWTWYADFSTKTISIPSRVFAPLTMRYGDDDFIDLVFGEKDFLLRRSDQSSASISLSFAEHRVSQSDHKGQFKAFLGSLRLPIEQLTSSFWIRCESEQIRYVLFSQWEVAL